CLPGRCAWNLLARQGDQGAVGATGATGAKGDPGVAEYEIVIKTEDGVAVDAGKTNNVLALCPAGKTVLGGGGTSSQPLMALYHSIPTLSGKPPAVVQSGWSASFRNDFAFLVAGSFTAYAICGKVNG
ncbi:MAG: hypothetical protein M3303_15685, partial [Gemmatimonadota bacterium]|nr:hypothetical protein [Gemmatimonadota bacterium]